MGSNPISATLKFLINVISILQMKDNHMGSSGGIILIKLSDAEEKLEQIIDLFVKREYNIPGEKREKWAYNKNLYLYEKIGLVSWKEDFSVSSKVEIPFAKIAERYSPYINIWKDTSFSKYPLLVLSYGDNIDSDFLEDLTDLLYDKIILRQTTWT